MAACLLESLDLLAGADEILRRHCVEGIEADEARCRLHVETSTAAATALVPAIGYEAATEVVAEAHATGRSVREVAVSRGLVGDDDFDELLSPEAVTRLGMPAAARPQRGRLARRRWVSWTPRAACASTSASSAGATWASRAS